ncbi:MAG: MBL fold metallo-hydrolase [Acidobacteriota bacterium]
MKWGNLEVHPISDGRIWLDGGAMFGVVPKPLWEKKVTPDGRNRIPLGLNCLLIQSGAENVLIDTGCGHKYSEKDLQIYRIEHQTNVAGELERLDLKPKDVDIVVNTHLHFDHCGGNTVRRGRAVVPTFPNATYFVQRREYEDACRPNERTRATYLRENWEPIVESGRLHLVDGDEEIVPGLTAVPTPGHTLGHQSIKVRSGGRILFFIGDLCPTSAHVPLPWIMGYDLEPLTTLATRREIYRQAASEDWLLFFEHDPVLLCGRLRQEEGKYVLQPESWADHL